MHDGGPSDARSRRLREGCGEYAAAVLLVGLTGGIGSGKSTVAAMLAERGAVVVDADAVAREVVEPGTPALAKLVERFGDDVLAADGTLDRAALAEKAFVDDESRKALEDITHPAINEEFMRRIVEAPDDAVVICDVPLLAESTQAQARGYKVVIVVEAPIDVRLARLEQRGVPRDDAQRRIAAQASDEQRRELATHLVDNSGDLAALEAQVDTLWTDLLERKAGVDAKADADADADADG
jgi:dephospho-CoA kinase